MKMTTVVICLVIAAFDRSAGPQGCTSAAHEEWISKSLNEMQTIKVGVTREDFLKVFTRAGGFFTSNRLKGTYAYKGSPYIKVDVEFSEAPGMGNHSKENAKDTVREISKPYLAQPMYD